jgi:histidyl-tRNA synthetase
MNYKTVKGTRDFLPSQMRKRNYIFDTIKEVYNAHGFQSIETPAMEELNTLMGKYGEEGDKLLFKILNSGDFTSNKTLDTTDHKALTKQICEKGLRYDLTVPFARFVVNHLNDITFPFKPLLESELNSLDCVPQATNKNNAAKIIKMCFICVIFILTSIQLTQLLL